MNEPLRPAGPIHAQGGQPAANPQPSTLQVPVTASDLYRIAKSVDDRLARIENLALTLARSVQVMSAQVDQNFLSLQSQVQQTLGVEQSAVTLIQGLANQLAAAIQANNNGDSAALPALQAQLASSAQSLAAAITANSGGTGTSTNTSTGTGTATSTATST